MRCKLKAAGEELLSLWARPHRRVDHSDTCRGGRLWTAKAGFRAREALAQCREAGLDSDGPSPELLPAG